MNRNEPSDLSPSQPSDFGPGQRNAYKFSPEELRTIKECSNESMFYRSIPSATFASAFTYWALNKKYLTASPQFGYFPKMAFAAVFGYILGKVSYQSVCAKKLMDLPNSKLGEHIRKIKSGQNSTLNIERDLSTPREANDVFNSIPAVPIFDDHKPDERDRVEGLDDYNRVNESLAEYREQPNESTTGHTIGYDERRKMNREQYNRQMYEKVKRDIQNLDQIQDSSPPQVPSEASPYSRPRKTTVNQYGDIIQD